MMILKEDFPDDFASAGAYRNTKNKPFRAVKMGGKD
jgi:hypothetical protein